MSQDSLSTVYIKHSDLPEIDIRQLPLILCEAVNEITPGHVNGAQLIGDLVDIAGISGNKELSDRGKLFSNNRKPSYFHIWGVSGYSEATADRESPFQKCPISRE